MKRAARIMTILADMRRANDMPVRLYFTMEMEDTIAMEAGMLPVPTKEVRTFAGVPVSAPFASDPSYALGQSGKRFEIPLIE